MPERTREAADRPSTSLATSPDQRDQNQESHPKLFGRFHDLVLLLIGFALTTLVGHWLSYQYQHREWNDRKKTELAQLNKERAREVFDDALSLSEHLFLDAQYLLHDIQTGNDHEKSLSKYRSSHSNWELRIHGLSVQIQVLFGDDLMRTYLTDVAGNFRFLDAQLQQIVDATDAVPLDPMREAEQALLEIRESNHSIYREMLRAVLEKGEEDATSEK